MLEQATDTSCCHMSVVNSPHTCVNKYGLTLSKQLIFFRHHFAKHYIVRSIRPQSWCQKLKLEEADPKPSLQAQNIQELSQVARRWYNGALLPDATSWKPQAFDHEYALCIAMGAVMKHG